MSFRIFESVRVDRGVWVCAREESRGDLLVYTKLIVFSKKCCLYIYFVDLKFVVVFPNIVFGCSNINSLFQLPRSSARLPTRSGITASCSAPSWTDLHFPRLHPSSYTIIRSRIAETFPATTFFGDDNFVSRVIMHCARSNTELCRFRIRSLHLKNIRCSFFLYTVQSNKFTIYKNTETNYKVSLFRSSFL